MVIPANLASVSELDGFKNYLSSTFSNTFTSQVIATNGFISATASSALNNTNSISQVQLQYSGESNNYYILNGTILTNWDSSKLQIQSYYYFDATNLNVFTVLVNQSGGNYTIPTITVNIRAFLFLAPF